MGELKAFNKAQLANPGVAQRMKSIPVFDKIKCKTCQEMRKKEFYSQNQLNELRYQLYRGGKKVNAFNAMIKCKLCTGFQANEMICSVCGEIKTLVDFAKAQRHNPDSARCRACARFVAVTEPGLEVLDEEDDDSDFSDEESETTIPPRSPFGDLEIRTAERSDDASISSGTGDISTLGDKNSAREGKQPLYGGIINAGFIDAMTTLYKTESKGAGNANSVVSSGSFLGGAELPHRNSMQKIAATWDRGGLGDLHNHDPFFTALDNDGYAFLRQADRVSSGGKSVSEFSELSRGGWGKVKETGDFVTSWMGEKDPTPAKPNEQIQKKAIASSASYFDMAGDSD